MNSLTPAPRSLRWRLAGTLLSFGGGLNLRDSPVELAPNETPSSLNWTLDQRGALRMRGGTANAASLPGDSGTPAFLFYSQTFDLWLCARKSGTNFVLYTRPGDFSGSWTSRGNLATVNAASMEAGFVEFSGTTPVVVITCAAPGLSGGSVFTWNNTTLSDTVANVRGTAIAVWQNRVWVAGYPQNDANGNVSRLFGSKIGDPTKWSAPDGLTNDLRDIDADALTALSVVGGALVAFKQRSAYRVTDSNTGSYTTIDPSSGCVGARALVRLQGRLYTWGQRGIYQWNGVGPGLNVVPRLLPLFNSVNGNIEPAGISQIAGGLLADRLLFAYPVAPFGNNTDLLEVDPVNGWAMHHQLGNVSFNEISSFGAQFGPLVNEVGRLFGAVRDGNVIYEMFKDIVPGKDAATTYTATYRTAWWQPMGGLLTRLQGLGIEGLIALGSTATLTLSIYRDFSLGNPITIALAPNLIQANATDDERRTAIQINTLGRAFAFGFTATSNTVGDLSLTSLDLRGLLAAIR